MIRQIPTYHNPDYSIIKVAAELHVLATAIDLKTNMDYLRYLVRKSKSERKTRFRIGPACFSFGNQPSEIHCDIGRFKDCSIAFD